MKNKTTANKILPGENIIQIKIMILIIPAVLTFLLLFSDWSAAETKADKTVDQTQENKTDDLKIIKAKLRKTLLSKVNSKTTPPLGKDDLWSTINYKDQNRGYWRTMTHLNYARALASDPKRHDEAIRALTAWQKMDPKNPNWWWMEIGIPQTVCEAMILLGDDLPDHLLESYRPILARAKPGMTGQNKVWAAEIHLLKGILYNNTEMVRDGCEQILSEIKMVPFGQEGIQTDYSFHQHGSQLQIGNYGLSFLIDSVRWAHLLEGTSFQLTDKQLDLLDHLFYDMTRMVMFKGFFDYNACARQLGTNAPIRKHSNAFYAAQSLRSLLPKERQELYLSAMPKKNLVVARETRWYPCSAYLIHRPSDDWYFSVRMSTPKIIGCETVNSENASGKFGADGVTFLLCDAKEYLNILPWWSWRHLPGTTEVQDSGSLTARGIRNKKGFAVGLTGERCGLTAFRFAPEEITANKIWFCFPNCVVCRGFEITSSSDNEVHTTIEQSICRGEVLIQREGKTEIAKEGVTDLTGAESVIHHGIEYRLFPNQRYSLKISVENGDIRTVNSAEPSYPMSGKVFLLTVNHGVKPKNSSYCYLLIPKNESTSYEKSNDQQKDNIQILKTSSSQIFAAADEKSHLVMIAAFKPGKVFLTDGFVKLIKKPSLILIQNGSEKSIPLSKNDSASNP